ncbi:MAG: D-hexose-6-phosphate mutarotase [Micropruina sp.]
MSHEITSTPLAGIHATPGAGNYGVYDHGAHVWAWQPDGSAPVLWMSSHSGYATGTAIRGGIPVIFPWFGPGRGGTLSPAHGFVRAREWRRDEVIEDADSLVVRYSVDETLTGSQQHFPFPYKAELSARFSAEALVVELTVTNSGTAEFSYEEALHTYLTIGDIAQVELTGLDKSRYLDKVLTQTGFDSRQRGAISFTGETDRIYASKGAVTIVDPRLNRRVVVAKEGSANTVIWNPGQHKADAMRDMGPGQWRTMVCIEAANVLGDAVVLAPGASHTMTQRISVEPLAE